MVPELVEGEGDFMHTQELHKLIETEQPNICQVTAYKAGEKVYSDCWNNYKIDDCAHVMSVTKSVFSLLIGIAIDKGQIKSVDDKVLDYFPEYKIKRGEKTIYDVTIKHLLTMRAPYKGKGDPWSKVCASENWTLMYHVSGEKQVRFRRIMLSGRVFRGRRRRRPSRTAPRGASPS